MAAQPFLVYNLGLIDTPYTHQGSFPAGTTGDSDYSNFSTVANGTSSDGISLTFDSLYGYLDLYLYNSEGKLINSSTDGTNGQSLSFAGLIPASNYQLEVLADGVGPAGVSYSMTIDPPAFVQPDAYDATNRNDSWGTATNLGLVTGTKTIPNLTLDSTYIASGYSDVDWYAFQTTGVGAQGDEVVLQFDPSQALFSWRSTTGRVTSWGRMKRSSTATRPASISRVRSGGLRHRGVYV